MHEQRPRTNRFFSGDYHKPMVDRFGEKYVRYRDQWDRSERGEYLPGFPLQLDFNIIDSCNMKCIMCPQYITKGSGDRLSLPDFKRVIDEGVQNELMAVGFGNGDEPLLNRNVVQMINYASAKGVMDIRLITNARLLKGRLAMEVAESGLTWVSFSLDAVTRATYRRIRRAELDVAEKNIIDFVELLHRRGKLIPVTRASFVLMEENKAEVRSFISKWSSLVDFVDVQTYINYSCTDEATDLSSFSCFQPWQRLSVLTSGDLTPCCMFWGRTLVMGNIKDSDIASVWNSGQMQELRQAILTKQAPKQCRVCYRSITRIDLDALLGDN